MLVRTGPQTEIDYGFKRVDGPKEWADMLENGLVWHDYTSIPQPLAYKNKMDALRKALQQPGGDEDEEGNDDGASASESKGPDPVPRHAGQITADHRSSSNKNSKLPPSHAGAPAPAASHAGAPPAAAPSHAGAISADHRRHAGDAGPASEDAAADAMLDKLTQQLTQAVDSIPSYVERSAMLWVLVPPVAHQDVPGAICDFNSWRSRGWCRMEYIASGLTTKDMPVMVVKNCVDPPEYFSPCDALKLAAMGGNFSVEDDRGKVMEVLRKMLQHKITFYEAQGDHTLARLTRCFSPMMTGGVDRFEEDDAGANAVGAGAGGGAGAGETAVDRLKRRLKWRDEATEAAWTQETGWNIMSLAAMLDDAAAVKELCALPNAAELMSAKGKAFPNDVHAYQKFPFAQKIRKLSVGHRPLMGAMAYGSPGVVTNMLAAGCPVPKGRKDQANTFGGSACHSPLGAIFNGRTDNIEAFMAAKPGAVDLAMREPMSNFNLMHHAATADTRHVVPTLKWLVAQGVHGKALRQRMMFGVNPVEMCVGNPEAGIEAFELLWDLDPAYHQANLNRYVEQSKLMKTMFRVVKVASVVSGTAGAMKKMLGDFMMKGTCLHWAALVGNLPMIAKLLDLGADPTLRTKMSGAGPTRGMTFFEILQLKFPESAAPTAAAVLLEAKGFGSVVAAAETGRASRALARRKRLVERDAVKHGIKHGVKRTAAPKVGQVAPLQQLA